MKAVNLIVVALLALAVFGVWGAIAYFGLPSIETKLAAANATQTARASPNTTAVPGPRTVTLGSSPTRPAASVTPISLRASGTPTATRSATATVRATPTDNWTDYAMSDEGFALRLPKEWLGLPLNPQQTQALIDRAKQDYPSAAGALDSFGSQAAANIALKFVGLETNPSITAAGFVPNVTVVRVPVPNGATFDAFVGLNLAQLEQIQNRVGESKLEKVTLAGVQAERVTSIFRYSKADGSSFQASVIQYLVLGNQSGYIVSQSALPTQLPTYQAVFDKMAAEFRLTR